MLEKHVPAFFCTNLIFFSAVEQIKYWKKLSHLSISFSDPECFESGETEPLGDPLGVESAILYDDRIKTFEPPA